MGKIVSYAIFFGKMLIGLENTSAIVIWAIF